MTITNVFACISVADYHASVAWYERLLGREPDLLPNEREAAWQLTETGWMYVVADPDRAGNAVLTVLVQDLERHVAELAEREVAIGAIDAVPGVVRKAVATDPDGNIVAFAEPDGG